MDGVSVPTVGGATFAPRLRLGANELLMELARGGVATAIVARKVGAAGFERLVVIKRVHRNLLGNADFGKMFRDEARLASSVRHANVASVIDVIETGSELCLVMEYFEALSLSWLLASAGEERRPSPRIISRILSDALRGLHAAHEATDLRGEPLGIVHRDFTPQNIICDTDGVTRVIDFGIAKATSRLTRTKSGIVKGKVSYMAPEQIEAQPVDARTDVFAAGVVLYEALTGHMLFGGKDDFAVMRHILRGQVPAPSSSAREVPPALDAVVARALARSTKARFPTALALQAALEAALPPASPREVSVWVQSVGGSILARRRKDLLDMLRQGAERPAAAGAGRVLEEAPSRELEFVDPATVTGELEAAGVPRHGRGSRVAAVLTLLLLATGGALALWWSHR